MPDEFHDSTAISAARDLAQEIVLGHPLLMSSQADLGVVLAGSRAVGYQSLSSDYDFLVICETEVFDRIAKRAGKASDAKGVDIPVDREALKREAGAAVDIAVYDIGRLSRAFSEYRDVVLWIWMNAKSLFDPAGRIAALQDSFKGYPREVLERKLKRHFLRDFHLSVHGLTYVPESDNVFSIVYGISAKVAEFCKLCCLLDGKPFPYEKWLLRACRDTTTGQKLYPFLERSIDSLTRLHGGLANSAGLLTKTVRALDTEACDILESALVEWGIDRSWIKDAYGCLEDVLFEEA
jgi:predicted nucleotidyltransferase